MQAQSRTVTSSQAGPHPRLAERVRRHLRGGWRQPVADHSRAAFAACVSRVEAFRGPLLLDSGCGTGASTCMLAGRHPQALVLGVDKSEARLSRTRLDTLPDNALLIRSDLVDFWRLALAAGWRFQRHFLFYPNPWPKSDQLQRRWHGHPVLPALLQLSDHLELRSNWRIYVEEWRVMLHLAGWATRTAVFAGGLPDHAVVSPFERKYLRSGQSCWRCVGRPRGQGA